MSREHSGAANEIVVEDVEAERNSWSSWVGWSVVGGRGSAGRRKCSDEGEVACM